MEAGEAEETLRGLQRLRSETAAKARAPAAPLFAWAAAALGSIVPCEVAGISGGRATDKIIVEDTNMGTVVTESLASPSMAKVAIVMGLYWLAAGALASIMTWRAYRDQPVHPERPKSSNGEKLILLILLVLFAPAALGGLFVFGGPETWPFLVASVAMILMGRGTRHPALERVGMYSLPALVLTAIVPGHRCAVAGATYALMLGGSGVVLRIRERTAA